MLDMTICCCRRLRVPGFSGAHVKEYRRPTAKALHQARTAAVRKETTAASEAAAVAAEKQKVTFVCLKSTYNPSTWATSPTLVSFNFPSVDFWSLHFPNINVSGGWAARKAGW